MPQTHVVRQGECLSSIAKRYGFLDWRTIYEHADNAEFKQQRPNPDVILPGDRLVIPAKAPRKVDVAAGKEHRFEAKRTQALLRLVLLRDDEEPLADAAYELSVGSAVTKGATDGDGKLEQPIPADAQRARLVFPDERLELDLLLGHLDPAEEPAGIQARLNNLGYWCGEVDGIVGPKTQRAIRSFQFAQGLDPTGEVDDDTRSKLVEAHEGA